MTSTLTQALLHPLSRRVGWVVYAIVFYLSGESFVVWLLEPENFTGGVRWLGVAVFPALFIAFFFIQRHLGCASGQCAVENTGNKSSKNSGSYRSPPGF